MSMDMAQYQCHKIVSAGQIIAIAETISGTRISYRDRRDTAAWTDVSAQWMAKHAPKAGGYLVLYDDGYLSFSPQTAFENGYSKVETKVETISDK